MDGNLLVERIRLLCRQNGTSLTKLETHFGFGNGAIGKWKKTKPPYERLQKVADYFGVTVAELTGENQKEKPTTQEGSELDELLTGLSPEERARVADFIGGLIAARKYK